MNMKVLFVIARIIVVGTHKIIADCVPNKVLGVAKLRDGRIYELQHLRTPI